MSFLSIMFLAGMAAVSAPIMIHMIRRAPRDNFKFSTLRFLNPSPEVVATRSKIQHWLLLFLRAMVIILLSLAFARPFLSNADEKDIAQQDACVLFMVDVSASMQSEDVREELIQKATERINLLKNTDHAALMFFSRDCQRILSFEKWNELPAASRKQTLLSALEKYKTDWSESRIADCLIQAADKVDAYLDEAGLAQADIELFGDLQEGAGLDSLKRFKWSKKLKLITHQIGTEKENASLHFLSFNEEKKEVKVRVINHSGKLLNLKIELQAEDINIYENELPLKAAKNHVLTIPVSTLNPDVKSFQVSLSGDEDSFDNTVYCALPVKQKEKILFLGSDKKVNSSFFYLKRFFPADDESVSLVVDDVSVLQKKTAFVVIDRPLHEEEPPLLKSYIQLGGTVLCLVSSKEMASSLKALSAEEISIEERKADDYLMWSQMDLKHWLYKPFNEARFKDFSSIYFWKYRQLNLAPKTSFKSISKFDNGDDAVLSKLSGKGELLLFTSSWAAADSQLALNSKFIPLMNAILKSGNGHSDRQYQFLCGEPTHSSITENKAGVYKVEQGESQFLVAKNIPPTESKIEKLADPDFQNAGIQVVLNKDLGKHLKSRYAGTESSRKTEESRTSLWRYLILGVLFFIFLESIAAHFTHKRMDSHEA